MSKNFSISGRKIILLAGLIAIAPFSTDARATIIEVIRGTDRTYVNTEKKEILRGSESSDLQMNRRKQVYLASVIPLPQQEDKEAIEIFRGNKNSNYVFSDKQKNIRVIRGVLETESDVPITKRLVANEPKATYHLAKEGAQYLERPLNEPSFIDPPEKWDRYNASISPKREKSNLELIAQISNPIKNSTKDKQNPFYNDEINRKIAYHSLVEVGKIPEGVNDIRYLEGAAAVFSDNNLSIYTYKSGKRKGQIGFRDTKTGHFVSKKDALSTIEEKMKYYERGELTRAEYFSSKLDKIMSPVTDFLDKIDEVYAPSNLPGLGKAAYALVRR